MAKYLILHTFFFLIAISLVQCGIFGRSNQHYSQSGSQYGRGGYNSGASTYDQYNYNSRSGYTNQGEQSTSSTYSEQATNKNGRGRIGISAWGLITIILLIILIGMAGYYGILCYPLICKEERNYDIMDAASSTASANTPTRSGDFEKSGNYSSRSTTPSVIISTKDSI